MKSGAFEPIGSGSRGNQESIIGGLIFFFATAKIADHVMFRISNLAGNCLYVIEK